MVEANRERRLHDGSGWRTRPETVAGSDRRTAMHIRKGAKGAQHNRKCTDLLDTVAVVDVNVDVDNALVVPAQHTFHTSEQPRSTVPAVSAFVGSAVLT